MNFYDFNGMNGDSNNSNNRCQKDDFQSKLNEYASKSETELMRELNDAVKKMKEEGSFDVDMLENLYKTAAPLLNDMQRGRMRSIIDMLKG